MYGLPQVFAKSVHFVPHSNGTLAVGSTSENEFSSPNATDEGLDRLIEIQEALFPNYENTNLLNDGQMFDQEVSREHQ